MTTARPIVLASAPVPATRPRHMWAGSPAIQYFARQPGISVPVADEEMSVTSVPQNWDTTPEFRPNFPEIVTGDYGASTDPYLVDGGRLLQSWASDLGQDSVLPEAPDFPMLGTVASWRDVMRLIWSLGVHDETSTVAAQVGATPTFRATFTAGAGPSIGFRLDWFVQMLNYGPFDMNIVTTGWTAGYTTLDSGVGAVAGTQPSADRSLVLRMRGGINGGSFFIPWGVRFGQGMNYAMHSIARAIPPVEGTPPRIEVQNLPAGIIPAFGFTVRLLTAYSPNSALASRLWETYARSGQ